MNRDVNVAAKIDAATNAALDRLALELDRKKSWLICDAIRHYIAARAAPSQESTPHTPEIPGSRLPPPPAPKPPPPAEPTLALTIPPQHKPNPAWQANELYNAMARECGLPISRSCSLRRQKQLNARLKDLGGLVGWMDALNCVRNSGFIQSGKWTNFSIDSLLQPRTIEKLMDGAYAIERDDRTHKEKEHDKREQAYKNILDTAFNT